MLARTRCPFGRLLQDPEGFLRFHVDTFAFGGRLFLRRGCLRLGGRLLRCCRLGGCPGGPSSPLSGLEYVATLKAFLVRVAILAAQFLALPTRAAPIGRFFFLWGGVRGAGRGRGRWVSDGASAGAAGNLPNVRAHVPRRRGFRSGGTCGGCLHFDVTPVSFWFAVCVFCAFCLGLRVRDVEVTCMSSGRGGQMHAKL